jgi:hypothetical protein
MMTSRERLTCAMRRGIPDRIPVAPYTLAGRDLDSPLGRRLLEETDLLFEVYLRTYPFQGQNPPLRTEERGEEFLTHYDTPRGTLTQVDQRERTASGTVRFPCRTAEDAEMIMEMDFVPSEFDLERWQESEERVGEEGLCLGTLLDGLVWPALMFSPEDFCMLWAEAPEVMHRMVELGTERTAEWLERACRKGITCWRFVGGEYASVQLGPQAYQELVVEQDRKLVEIIHRHGGLAHFHNHGSIMRYLDQVLEIGVDSLDPLEAPPWGDADLAAAKEKLRGRVCMVGNLDDMEFLGKRSREEILGRGRELIEQAGPDGFILGGTSSVTYTDQAAEDFLALAAMSRELAGHC